MTQPALVPGIVEDKQPANAPANGDGQQVTTNKLLKMRLERCLSYGEIARITGLKKPTVYDRIGWIERIIADPAKLEAYRHNSSTILRGVEMGLVELLADPEKQQKASLNNVAYALGQVHQARRLEEDKSTSNVSSIEYALRVIEDRRKKAKVEG